MLSFGGPKFLFLRKFVKFSMSCRFFIIPGGKDVVVTDLQLPDKIMIMKKKKLIL